MSRFVQVDRDTAYLLPPSVQEWLPKDHLARYVVDVVEALDRSGLVRRLQAARRAPRPGSSG